MGLYELWCLYVPGSYKFCDSETLPLLKTWIDILYENNTIGIDELRKCARAIRVRRAKLITALIDSQTCVMFEPVATTLILLLTKQLVFDKYPVSVPALSENTPDEGGDNEF